MDVEKLVLALYRLKGLSKRKQKMIDELALELVGESYVWPKSK